MFCLERDLQHAILRRARLPVLLGVTLALGLLAGACRATIDPAPDINLTWEIAPQPPQTGPATVTLELADKSGRPVSGAQARLEGNMSHPGMRPVFSKANEIGPGRYQGPLEFTMGGDWVVLVHLILPDGRRLERKIDVKGVKAREREEAER